MVLPSFKVLHKIGSTRLPDISPTLVRSFAKNSMVKIDPSRHVCILDLGPMRELSSNNHAGSQAAAEGLETRYST